MARVDTPTALPWLLRQLALPLNRLPGRPLQQASIVLLNKIFATAIAGGELDFFSGRSVRILVEDIRFELCFGFDGKQFQALPVDSVADVSLCADAACFMLLLSRREDPDTLFFQRRLRIEGQVDLGLGLKNFLDAWERPYAVEQLERLCGFSLDVLDKKPKPRD